MCNSILTLFYGEKLKDTLCLADFCLFWAKTDYSLPLAALYTHFSESKESPARINGAKDFRGSIAAAKAWLRGGFRLPKLFFASESSKILVLHYPQNYDAKSPRDKRADMGFCTKLNHFCKNVTFNIRKQSTGQSFLPSSLTRDDFAEF